MAELEDYSITADSNSSASPNGWPEGMAPSGVNNSDREFAARMKRYWSRSGRNFITGLRLTNNGTDANNDIDIAVGAARDTTNASDIELATALTKRLDATWAVGTNQGGLDTGAKANSTMYAVWLIKRSDTGVVDCLFSTSWVSPTMPTNYDYKRLIGGIRTDGSGNIVAFQQVDDYFQYFADLVDVNDNTLTAASFETGTMSVPPYCIGNFSVLANDSGATTDMSVALRTKGSTNTANRVMSDSYASKTGRQRTTTIAMAVDSNLQIEYAIGAEVSVAQIIIVTLGFWMSTRRMPL